MEKILLIVLFFLEVITYYLAYRVFNGEKLTGHLYPIWGATILGLVMLIWSGADKSFFVVLMTFEVLCIVIIAQKGNWRDRIQRILILFFLLSSAEAFLDEFLDLFLWKGENDTVCDSLLESLMMLSMIAGIGMLKRKLRWGKKGYLFMKLKKFSLPLLMLMALEIVMTIAGLEYVRGFVPDARSQNALTFLIMCSYLGIGILGIFLLYAKHMNSEMEKQVEREQQFQNMQRHYYETLLEREKDTRRYRHDMVNHLLCLSHYAENGDIKALNDYLVALRQGIQDIQKRDYVTGNQILDVLTNHFVEMLPPSAEVRVFGRVQIKLDEMRLCIIYANLLQNAVEELQRCPGASLLEIRLEQGSRYCSITVCNSLSEESRQTRKVERIETKKKDKSNHGFGLINVQRAVEDVDGRFELQMDTDCFRATVFLPL